MQRIYLDACAVNRLFDDRIQARVRAEAEAIESFYQLLLSRRIDWMTSEVREAELLNNPNSLARKRTLELVSIATQRLVISAASFLRADQLERLGYGAFDALHLAAAEQGNADMLLTTDDRFFRQARRGLGRPTVRVENPIDWAKGIVP